MSRNFGLRSFQGSSAVESSAVNRLVVGSNPTPEANSMGGRVGLTGVSTNAPAYRAYSTPRDSHLTVSDFAFPRGNFSQTCIDIATLIFCALFVCLGGLAITVSIFVLLFVGVH